MLTYDGFCVKGNAKILVINANRTANIHKRPVERLVDYILRHEAAHARELNIVFIGDKEMTRLHRKFLHRNSTTDVISFPFDGDLRRRSVEGEVYVNVDQARRQAKTFGVSVRDEIRRLVIHGILHLTGYDDTTKTTKKIMRSLEDKYLRWKNH